MLKYISKGNGKVLLLLHGYKSCKESFVNQIDFFSKYYKVIAVDLSGFGENNKLESVYFLDDYILDLIKFLKGKNITDFDVICHSFGARLILKSDELRSMCGKLIITGGAGLKTKKGIRYYFKIYTYKFLKKICPNSKILNKFGSAEYRLLSNLEKQTYKNIVNENLDYKLKDIKNKTLIIYGDRDKTTPLYLAKRLKKGITGSRLYVIKGAGHFAFIDKIREFNYIAKEFLLSQE